MSNFLSVRSRFGLQGWNAFGTMFPSDSCIKEVQHETLAHRAPLFSPAGLPVEGKVLPERT